MKKDRLNVFFMAAIAILAVGAVSAFGFGWFNPNGSNGENSTDMQAFHQEVQTAIQNDDYATWKSLMESQLTEENFQNIVDMHKKMSEIQDLRQQLKDAVANGNTGTANQLKTQLQAIIPQWPDRANSTENGMAYMKKFGHRFGFSENDSD